MSTKDQTLSAKLHGEALLTARRPELQPLIDHLREVAQGRDDIRIECAGVIAGSWFASGVRRGEELIAAGLLMLAGRATNDTNNRHTYGKRQTLISRRIDIPASLSASVEASGMAAEHSAQQTLE